MLIGLWTAFITALALTLVPVRPAHAQSTARVQIALVDSLSLPSARAEVVRFDGGRPDLILLRSSTVRADDIVAGLMALKRSREARPARPGLIARLTVVSASTTERVDRRQIRQADEILRQLKAAPSVRVGNVGRGRWGEFDVSH